MFANMHVNKFYLSRHACKYLSRQKNMAAIFDSLAWHPPPPTHGTDLTSSPFLMLLVPWCGPFVTCDSIPWCPQIPLTPDSWNGLIKFTVRSSLKRQLVFNYLLMKSASTNLRYYTINQYFWSNKSFKNIKLVSRCTCMRFLDLCWFWRANSPWICDLRQYLQNTDLNLSRYSNSRSFPTHGKYTSRSAKCSQFCPCIRQLRRAKICLKIYLFPWCSANTCTFPLPYSESMIIFNLL